MPDGIDWGIYPANLTRGTQVSSTYEGRHITMTAAELRTATAEGTAVKGYPCVFGLVADQMVGICLESGTLTDLIAVDTEGIWNVSVTANDDDGGSLVSGGDLLYIGIGDGLVSKISNSVTHVPFGWALGSVPSADVEIIAVKVHSFPKCVGSPGGLNHVMGDLADPIALGTTGVVPISMHTSSGIMAGSGCKGISIVHTMTADSPAGTVNGLIYLENIVGYGVVDAYAQRIYTHINPGAAETVDSLMGLRLEVNVDNAGFTITQTDNVYGIHIRMRQSATSVLSGGGAGDLSFVGIMVDMAYIYTDNVYPSRGFFARMGGGGATYPGYGFSVQCESNNSLAGFHVCCRTSAVLPAVMLVDTETGRMENFLSFTNAATAEAHTDILEAETSNVAPDYAIRVNLVGDAVVRYLHLHPPA